MRGRRRQGQKMWLDPLPLASSFYSTGKKYGERILGKDVGKRRLVRGGWMISTL